MSKKYHVSAPTNGEAVAQFHNYQMSHLEGQMLTIIEGIGLQSKQEEAIKSLVRKALWDSWIEAEKVIKEYSELGNQVSTSS
jgi:hypothetical protein